MKAFKWREISQSRLEEHKSEFPKKLEHVKATQKKLFLQNLKQVSFVFSLKFLNTPKLH